MVDLFISNPNYYWEKVAIQDSTNKMVLIYGGLKNQHFYGYWFVIFGQYLPWPKHESNVCILMRTAGSVDMFTHFLYVKPSNQNVFFCLQMQKYAHPADNFNECGQLSNLSIYSIFQTVQWQCSWWRFYEFQSFIALIFSNRFAHDENVFSLAVTSNDFSFWYSAHKFSLLVAKGARQRERNIPNQAFFSQFYMTFSLPNVSSSSSWVCGSLSL